MGGWHVITHIKEIFTHAILLVLDTQEGVKGREDARLCPRLPVVLPVFTLRPVSKALWQARIIPPPAHVESHAMIVNVWVARLVHASKDTLNGAQACLNLFQSLHQRCSEWEAIPVVITAPLTLTTIDVSPIEATA